MSKQTRTRVLNVLLPVLGVATALAIAVGSSAVQTLATTLLAVVVPGALVASLIAVMRRRRQP